MRRGINLIMVCHPAPPKLFCHQKGYPVDSWSVCFVQPFPGHIPREGLAELEVLHRDGMVREPSFRGFEAQIMELAQAVVVERSEPVILSNSVYHRYCIR